MGEEITWILFAIIVIRYKHWFYIYNSLRNELGNKIADGNRIAMRENQTNPLYVKGYLRKISKKNSHWKMARLKGLFITQIIAIIEMIALLIVMTAVLYENYIGNAGMLGWIAAKREKIYIMSFILICLNGYMSVFFQMHYQHIIEKTRKKIMRNFLLQV